MADKYLNIALTTAGVITPLKVDGVVKIAVSAIGTAARAILTYEGGAQATLTTTVRAAATTAGSFVPQGAAQLANFQKGLWDAVIRSAAMPWNLPVYPSQGQAWDQTFMPASQANSPIPSGNVGPTGGAATPPTRASVGPVSSQASKTSQEIVGFNQAAGGGTGTVTGAVVFATIA